MQYDYAKHILMDAENERLRLLLNTSRKPKERIKYINTGARVLTSDEALELMKEEELRRVWEQLFKELRPVAGAYNRRAKERDDVVKAAGKAAAKELEAMERASRKVAKEQQEMAEKEVKRLEKAEAKRLKDLQAAEEKERERERKTEEKRLKDLEVAAVKEREPQRKAAEKELERLRKEALKADKPPVSDSFIIYIHC